MTIANSDVGLGIYTEPKQETRISTNETNTNPLLFVFDGTEGGVLERLLYVGSNDETYAYLGPDANSYPDNPDTSKVEVQLIDPEHYTDEIQTSWSWKLQEGVDRPTTDEWALVTPGASITLPGNFYNIFNSGDGGKWQFYPFWVRIEVPEQTGAKMIASVRFQIRATRMPLGWYLE